MQGTLGAGHLIRESEGEVGDDVVGGFDTDRHTNRPRSNSELGALRRTEAAMRGYLWVRNRGLHTAKAGGEPDHLEPRKHSLHRRAAAGEVEGEHPSSSFRHQPQSDLAKRRALEPRVINGGDAGHPAQGSSEGDAVVAVPAHTQVQGPEAAQREPRIEWPQSAPGSNRPCPRGRHQVLAPDHNAREQVGVAADVFRRAVHYGGGSYPEGAEKDW